MSKEFIEVVGHFFKSNVLVVCTSKLKPCILRSM